MHTKELPMRMAKKRKVRKWVKVGEAHELGVNLTCIVFKLGEKRYRIISNLFGSGLRVDELKEVDIKDLSLLEREFLNK